MDENKLKTIVEEVVNKALEPIKETLENHTELLENHTELLENHTKLLENHTKLLENHTELLENHTAALVNIENKLDGFADSYKINQHNIERVDTRLTTVEDELNIEVPEDLKVPHFSSK